MVGIRCVHTKKKTITIYYVGTGKAKNGLCISAVMDGESRFILGCLVGQEEKLKKGEKYTELEKTTIQVANAKTKVYKLPEIVDPERNSRVSSFFASLNAEFLGRSAYDTADELREIVERYLTFYNFTRVQSGLKSNPYNAMMREK